MLRYRADLRTLAFIASYFLLILLGFGSSLSLLQTVGLMLMLSILSFLCAVITHNTVHTPIWYSKTLNRVTQIILTLTYGHPVSAYVPGHNLSHHMHTQTAKDLMRTSKLRYKWNLLNQLLFAWTVGPTIFLANWQFAKKAYREDPAWFRQFTLETIAYISYLSLALVLDVQKFILFVVIPHQFAAWGIMGINYVQHDGCHASHSYNHSRNFTGRLINWLTFNNGYHGIHHMHPDLHWSLLPEVHNKELKPFIHPNLDQNNFPKYLWYSFVWPGQRVDFLGNPVVLPPPVEDEQWLPPIAQIDPTHLGSR